jgi:hypothetical protein
MIVEDQQAVQRFLADPATYGAAGPVEAIETHISRIFLVGNRAYKLKRAVKLPYVDFSTPQLRLATCLEEVRMNSSTAPGLYLGVKRITRQPSGALAFDGSGEPVDAVIEMTRFDQAALFDRMAVDGKLTPALMTAVARMVVAFHRQAPVVHASTGSANIAAVLDINEAGFATGSVFSPAEIGDLASRFRAAIARHAALLDRREMEGKVRRCHGDLHLRNICLLDGEPRLFDCIEFNEQIATTDVLYDLAFLLMDLWHRGFRDLANLVVNRYLDEADDEDGFALLPIFMAVRAAVRAHVTATQVAEASARSEGLVAEARSYFDLARSLLDPGAPRLIAIGGLSGSGKSTIAEALAPHVGAPPGARIIESDRVRKALHGVSAETRLPATAYQAEVSEHVYAEMARRAGLILAAEGTVVADAVFDRRGDRERIARVADEQTAPFAGIWLQADSETLRRRVAARRSGASDADLEVLSRQLQRAPNVEWLQVDAGRPAAEVVAEVLRALGEEEAGFV